MTGVSERIGRYRLESEVGVGGMGRVFRAFDEQLRRPVALKIMHAGLEALTGVDVETWKLRLLREARAAAALNHPNIVGVYDVGEADGLPYIVMEFVAGRSLRDYIADGTAPLARRVRWLADVARALRAAHAEGLLHRDVKPANVIIREDGVVKVVDFGFARRFLPSVWPDASAGGGRRLTAQGTALGTPTYMAPEQLREQPVDARADQFAWGVTAYEVLTGRLPWEGAELPAVVSSILGDDPVLVSRRNSEVPPEVAAVIARALAKDPAARHPDMNAVVETLAPWAEPAPSATRLHSTLRPGQARVIDVPAAEPDPGRSRTWLLVVAAFVGAIGLGVALAFFWR